MAAYCYELLGCAACREFVVFEEYALAAPEDRPPRECPACSGPLRAVLSDSEHLPDGLALWEDGTGAKAAVIGACPKCGGELVGGVVGLWD